MSGVDLVEEFDVHEFCDRSKVGGPLRTVWVWRRTFPWAVEVTFFGSGDPVTWLIGRDVLAAGIDSGDAGRHEVRVRRRFGPSFALTLRSPEGEVTFAAPVGKVARLLRDSHRLVPPGREGDVFDAALSQALTEWAEDAR